MENPKKEFNYIKKLETLIALYEEDYEKIDMEYLKELANEGFAKLNRDTFSITAQGVQTARVIKICFDFADQTMGLFGKEIEQFFNFEGPLMEE